MVISPSALMGIMGLQLIVACKRSCGKVIFSVTSVCLSSQGGGVSQRTITNDALYITLQDFPRQGLAPAPAGDIRWEPKETCSLQDCSHQYWHWWLLKHVRSSQVDGTQPSWMLYCSACHQSHCNHWQNGVRLFYRDMSVNCFEIWRTL